MLLSSSLTKHRRQPDAPVAWDEIDIPDFEVFHAR